MRRNAEATHATDSTTVHNDPFEQEENVADVVLKGTFPNEINENSEALAKTSVHQVATEMSV